MKKSIIINQSFHNELKKLSKAFNIPIGRLTEHMIFYFKKTGIDPKDALNQNPSTMIKALDKRIVSFLKVQERDILKPMRADIYNYQKTIEESFDAIIETIKEDHINKNRSEMDSIIRNEQKKQQQLLVEIALSMDAKGKLGLQNKIRQIFS